MAKRKRTDGGEAAPEAETLAVKSPSFEGRLQLKDFMFTTGGVRAASGTATATAKEVVLARNDAVRRSPRLSAPTSRSAASASPSPSSSSSRKRDNKPAGSGGGLLSAEADMGQSDLATSPGSTAKITTTNAKGKKKQRSRQSTSYAPPSTYAHLSLLPDAIAPNLLILFIGLNPGIQTARTGHAYAHPSNLFWKLLFSSGITPVPCRADEDRTMPRRFGLGLTNIVARPSRNGAELSKAEMDAGVAALEHKCRLWRPECVCVVGKSIWESIFRVWRGRGPAKGEFAYGWQEERMGAGSPPPFHLDHNPEGAEGTIGEAHKKAEIAEKGALDGSGPSAPSQYEGARIFVATSTSGLAATLRPEEKERIWKELGDWCVQRRRERAEEEVEAGECS